MPTFWAHCVSWRGRAKPPTGQPNRNRAQPQPPARMAAERRELREALDDTSAQLTQLREAGAPIARLEGNVAKIEAALGALLPELRQEEEEGVLQANPLAQDGDGKAQVASYSSTAGDQEQRDPPRWRGARSSRPGVLRYRAPRL